jgi:hypothetical protein
LAEAEGLVEDEDDQDVYTVRNLLPNLLPKAEKNADIY